MMGIQVKWDNKDKTILLYSFAESWSWREYDAAMELGQEMIDAANKSVSVIMDFQHTRFAPPGGMRNVSKSFRHLSDVQLNKLVIVGATGLLQIMLDARRSLHPRTASCLVHTVTLEQAYKLLNQGVGAGA